MPYPLQFLEPDSQLFVSTPTTITSGTLPVGSSFSPGMMRLARVSVNGGSGTTWTTPTGWTKASDVANGSDRQAVFTRVLTATDADITLNWSTGSSITTIDSVTVINPNTTAAVVQSVATGTTATAVAPSVTATANGVLLNFNQFTAFGGTGSDPPIGVPAGMTNLGNGPEGSYASTQTAYVQSSFNAQTYTTAGATGTKSAAAPTSTTSAWSWFSASLFLAQNPDQTSALTAAAETDAGVAVTSALATTATNILTPAQEVDTAIEVYNPLRAVSIRPPVLLTDNPVSASRVSWSASTPAAGSAVLVETSLDNGASWQTALNGGAVPGLLRGDATTPVVLTRATMTRLLSTDTSPFFMTLKTEVSEDTSYNELVALGTFLITQVDITETGGPTGGGSGGGGGGNGVTGTGGSSTGGGLSLVVSGIDLSYAISRNTWTSIFYVPANTNYATAMLEIAQNRLPGITSDVASTEVTAQRLLFGTSQGADPWQDVQDMGTAIGSRAYFDPVGTFKVKPVADPALTPSVWTVSDAANPVMVSYTRSISDSTTYNYVVVSGESTSNTVPVSAVAFDADPSSPTYYLGPYNIVTTTFISAMITTTAQAQQAADALLLVVKGASETVQITMVPNPALEPGDVITVTRTYNGQAIIQGTFKINSMSTPIGQAQAQVLVCYRQSAAQG